MQSKIACSAGKLSLLQPDMIQQIVAGVAYQTGAQYAAENRVRLMSSDEAHISASVTGNFWMHEQDIKLKDGWLVSNCSCRVEEQPLCRHGIAALLAYQAALPAEARRAVGSEQEKAGARPAGKSREDGPADSVAAAERGKRAAIVLEAQVVEAVTVPVEVVMPVPPARPAGTVTASRPAAQSAPAAATAAMSGAAEPAAGEPQCSAAAAADGQPAAPAASGSRPPGAMSRDLKFSEIAQFIEWLQPAVEALRRSAPMPERPRDAHGEIEGWMRALLGLQGQFMESESGRQSLKAELQAARDVLVEKAGQLDRAQQQLQVARREARDLQAANAELQAALARSQAIITTLQDLGRQLDQCEGQIRAMGEELARKKSQHDQLAGSFKDIAAALRPLGKASATLATH